MSTFRFLNDNNQNITLEQALSTDRHEQVIEFDGTKYVGITGDDAFYFKKDDEIGVKIMPLEHKTYTNNLETIKKFKELQIPCFPKIYDIELQDDVLILTLKHIEEKTASYDDLKFCIECMNNFQLLPDNSWMKPVNIFGNKIVDFQRFRLMPERYSFPTHGKSIEEIRAIHQRALSRYKQSNKWKGKIYEGMFFDNGYSMQGYSSDHKTYDSYIKLHFCHLSGMDRVLDIGCNEGFFSIQSALLGTPEVVGIDRCEEDLEFAKELRDYLELHNIKYVLTDAAEYIDQNCNEKFSLILALSVIHQIYPHLINADKFLTQISNMGRRVLIETPVNHPKMQMPVELVQHKLKPFFRKDLRLLYVYNAYSTGERAIFIGYN